MFRIARYGGVAAAASVLFVVGVSFLVVDRGAGVAFADVVQNVKDASSVTFRNKQKIGRQPEMEFQWYLQGEQIRFEMPNVMAVIADLKMKKGLRLNMANKTARQMDLDDESMALFTNPVDQLRKAKPEDAELLGEESFGKLKAKVYRVQRVDFLGIQGKGEMKVWIDSISELPVKITVSDQEGKRFLSFDQFEWNKRLNKKLFRLEAPAGYTVNDLLGDPPADME
jgi:outer membrane lipoprotein-sorting protein